MSKDSREMKIIAFLENALYKVAGAKRETALPSDDHIVRYVKLSMIGDTSGKIRAMEFRLRENRPEEIGLSVNWLDAFPGDKKQQLSKVLQVNNSWFSVKIRGRYAEFNVGQLRNNVNETLEAGTLQIIHDPLRANNGRVADPSQSEIRGMPRAGTPEASLVGDLILESMRDEHPVSEIMAWGE